MANDLNTNGYYAFDDPDQDQSLRHEERPWLGKRIVNFLRSRHALLTVIFLLSGSLIFYNTAILQLSGTAATTVSETTGVSRQLSVPANRGDIVDASGVPLAFSKTINVLYLSYASLDDTKLNSMLLDLSLFLEANGVGYSSKLSNYLELSHEDCSHEPGEEGDCGQPLFLKDEPEIVYWQTDANLFLPQLRSATNLETPTVTNNLVKTDPSMFFD